MINTHMHLYSTFARGMDLKTDNSPPKNFVEILEKLWWRLDKTLNKEDIYYSAIYALLDCIKKGTTTIFDHHASSNLIDGSLDIITEAIRQTGIRANLSCEISDRDGHEKALAGIRENERFIKKIQQEGNNYLRGMIGLHASFTLKNETFILNGEAVSSCLILTGQIGGSEILTIEGLEVDGKLEPLQQAFIDHHAVQCGFCTPGMLMSAKALLIQNPHPSREEIKTALEGNLCRCTGYEQIIEAVESVTKN